PGPASVPAPRPSATAGSPTPSVFARKCPRSASVSSRSRSGWRGARPSRNRTARRGQAPGRSDRAQSERSLSSARTCPSASRRRRCTSPGCSCSPAPRRSRAARRLDRGLLQLGVELHTLLRARRAELDQLVDHALMRIGPDRHRLDGLATDLTEEFLNLLGIVHHDLLLLVLASPCTSCPCHRRLTHRVRV